MLMMRNLLHNNINLFNTKNNLLLPRSGARSVVTNIHNTNHYKIITLYQKHAKKIFNHPSQSELVYINLIEMILSQQLNSAISSYDRSKSNLLKLINQIPKNSSIDEKANILCEKLINYHAMPVITAHPTRVITNEAMMIIWELVNAELTGKISSEHDLKIHQLLSSKLVPTERLTPQQEAEFALFIYQKILDIYPFFQKEILTYFQNRHGNCSPIIIEQIKKALKYSFSNISSWVKGDADGNYKVTSETMQLTVPSQQIAILNLYIKRLINIREKPDIPNELKIHLNKIILRLEQLIIEVNAGIWFNAQGSQEWTNQIIEWLENASRIAPVSYKNKLLDVIELVELAGFYGGMKEYVRQTTEINQTVLDELLTILKENHSHIKNLFPGMYHDLSNEQKQQLHKELASDPKYFSTLKELQEEFSETTKRELSRLLFILHHADIFPFYICSDTKVKLNFDEVRILIHLSAFINKELRTNQIKYFPVNFLFLCETPEDIQDFPKIMTEILEDAALRDRIIKSGFISYVSGPSDLGKRGGVSTHISLYLAEITAHQILNNYKIKYPELNQVKLKVLNGYGGDLKRRIGSANQLLHSTHQGIDAYYNLAAPGAYLEHLHKTIGYPSETFFRVLELEKIKENNPEAFKVILKLEQTGIQAFQKFISSSASKELLKNLSYPEIENRMNISSRARSKAANHDITQVRAIGLVNLYLLTGIQWDVFMSALGWIDLTEMEKLQLNYCFQKSTVIKDIVYKIWYTIAVSDITRAWSKIAPNSTPTNLASLNKLAEDFKIVDSNNLNNSTTLAYIHIKSYDILKILIYFMPQSLQHNLTMLLESNIRRLEAPNIIAKKLIELLPGAMEFCQNIEDLSKQHQLLNTCLDQYKANRNELTLRNVILACRLTEIPKGPNFIANLTSGMRYEFQPQSMPKQAIDDSNCSEENRMKL